MSYQTSAIPILRDDYLVQIDALRAIAVSMVIYSHWAGYHGNFWIDDSKWFNGEVGVQLFFVISGFLITGILLDERAKAEKTAGSLGVVAKRFYIRRFLRIFPVFYATLFITYLLGHSDVRPSLLWHVTYLSNFYFAFRGDYLGDVSHFWSLAVEEQFYFLWPFIILLIPLRHVPKVIFIAILIGPFSRYVLEFLLHQNHVVVNVLPFSSLDALAGGALLSIIVRSTHKEKFEKWIFTTSIACASIYMAVWYFVDFSGEFAASGMFVARTALIPALAGIVLACARGIKIASAILEAKPLLYIGKISYGIYLFHFFIPPMVYWICYQIDFHMWERWGYAPFLIVNLTVLLLFSALSWHFFERRINDLKRYFPYNNAAESPNAWAGLSISNVKMFLFGK